MAKWNEMDWNEKLWWIKNTTNGKNLSVSLGSNEIGLLKESRVINEKFEYSSDNTLQPKANISPNIILKDSNTIGLVTITSGGSGYVKPPTTIVVNNNTRTPLDNGVILSKLTGNSITDLIVDIKPKGISDQSAELFAINTEIEKETWARLWLRPCVCSRAEGLNLGSL